MHIISLILQMNIEKRKASGTLHRKKSCHRVDIIASLVPLVRFRDYSFSVQHTDKTGHFPIFRTAGTGQLEIELFFHHRTETSTAYELFPF